MLYSRHSSRSRKSIQRRSSPSGREWGVRGMPTELEHFTKIFNNPSVETIYDELTPHEFERFVAFVLRRAGYDAKVVGPHWLRGIDVEMRLPGKSRIVGGVECKHFQKGLLVTAPVVKGVRGAPAVGGAGAKPLVITTSDFNKPAHQMALAEGKRTYLVNGSQLVRYINYDDSSARRDHQASAALIALSASSTPSPTSPAVAAQCKGTRARAPGSQRCSSGVRGSGAVRS